ncbi:MAG: phosphate signaling complex protein PhoU [Armatimonadetes bacterium]|jgi:phosphate transport system protein|nr:phosphate signaling complex protein PhoU [Armatimonadota bacterium]MDI9586664.1 phosphate signaling complex protein PhoU [Acidobacteriota bacterium]
MDSVRHTFDVELEKLDGTVLRMGEFVASMLHDAMDALVRQDEALARNVRDRDEVANQLDDEIEQSAMRLLALQQPVASDLRRVASVLKATTDLERVGDYASDIAQCAMRLAGDPYFAPLEDIPEMGRIVEGMIRDALKTYVTRDVVFGKSVRDRDKEVDRIYKRVYSQLLEWMEREPRVVHQASEMMFVARYLERLGDHTKNIIERIAYAETGSLRPWRTEEWKREHGAPPTEPGPEETPEEQVDHEE